MLQLSIDDCEITVSSQFIKLKYKLYDCRRLVQAGQPIWMEAKGTKFQGQQFFFFLNSFKHTKRCFSTLKKVKSENIKEENILNALPMLLGRIVDARQAH